MDSRLLMEIGFVNTAFRAVDNTPYEDWIDDSHNHMVIQRLLQIKSDDDNTVIACESKIAETIDSLKDSFEYDDVTSGLYYYQKLIIPEESHVTETNEKIFYDENGDIHFVDVDSEIDNILSINDDFDEIYNLIRQYYPDNCFYFDEYTFTMYDLIECYVLTERERINNYLKNNCSGNCDSADDLGLKADILLAAIMVIKNLIKKEDYFEAQRILNGLNTCGELCKKYTKRLKGCGCEGA